MIEIRTADEDDWPRMSRVDMQAFGYTMTAEDEERGRTALDFDRFRLAVDGTELVGVAGSWQLEMTLPGGVAVPTGGVTWVAVAVTHRRQGIMSQLIAAVHDDIDERGEPLAALTASEGGIYERLGYGIASRRRVTSIGRAGARFQERFVPPSGTVRLVDRVAERDRLMALWDRYRLARAGEISRRPLWWTIDEAERADNVYALHDDGFAAWRTEAHWNDGHPRHELYVTTLAAATPEAHAALWATILALDLVGTVVSYVVPHDDPLPYLLTNQRAVRTTDLNDGVWCNPRDVAHCFGARAYGTDADVVVEADGVRWRIGAAGVRKVRTKPDLVTDRAGLGALLLGGVVPTTLAAGRRLEARNAEALRRADAMFAVHPGPYLQTAF